MSRPCLAALLLTASILTWGSFADSEERIDGVVPRGSQDNTVVLMVSNPAEETAALDLTMDVTSVPPWMTVTAVEPDHEGPLAAGASRRFSVVFDVADNAAVGTEGDMVVSFVPTGAFIDRPSVRVRLQVIEPHVSVCALRADAPEDFPAEEAIDHCDTEREPMEYDRVAVFFTPPRDTREPLEERDPFMWRILGPNGNSQRGGRGAFAPKSEDENTPFAKEGSPGRFVAVLDLWNRDDKADPAKARSGPGTYTVQTVAAQYDVTGVFGQGEASLAIAVIGEDENGEQLFAEWEGVKSFEIPSRRLHFQGFVMEQVDDLSWPDRENVWEGKLTVNEPQVSGTSVTVDAEAWWRPAKINGYGRFPEEEILEVTSRLTLDFPEQLNPGHEEMGEISARMESLERTDFFFTAAMHLLIPSAQLPPDRHLIAGGGPAPWSVGGAESPDICRGESFTYSWMDRFGLEYDGPVVGDDPTFDFGGVYWLWPRVPLAPTFCLTREASVIDVRATLNSGKREDLAGDPARGFLANINDPETMWVIPVFLNLTDEARPNRQTLAMRTYGYTIYAAKPGTYTGPQPTGGPEGGDGPNESPEGDETDPDDPGTDPDDPGTDPDDPDGGIGPGDDDGPDGGVGPGGGGVPGEGDGPGGGGEPGGGDGPVDPNALDPNAPDIAGLISKWLGVAEPPENATDGAGLHYNEWGVKLGRAAGGIISGTPGRPDDVGARTSPEYVWGLRDQLDSVDHCTVGEYVVARLENASTAHCAGRYVRTIAVPRVQGLPVDDAVGDVRRQGLEPRVTILGPAPTREQADRVAEQRPSSTGRLAPGSAVELDAWGDFDEPMVEMPDLVGQSETLAAAWLEDLGLEPEIRTAGPAPFGEKTDRVAAQSQPPGASLPPGESVMLFVYGAPAPAPTPTPPLAPVVTQTTCDRSWPGTVLTRDPATGADNCLCPTGTAWSKVRHTCLSLGGAPPPRAADCRHMPGTIRNPATGACTCPVGAWDPSRGRCVDTAAADREREIADRNTAASCEKLYSDIILLRRNPSPAYREMAARAEREARDMGCDAGRIAEAIGTGGDGGDSPITPVTGPVETEDEGEARVSSRHVNICIIDVNSVLDDHFDLFVNGAYLGAVANPEGGEVCYGATLRSGANDLVLQLVATRGKSTFLKISINNDEYSATFGGSTNHAWSVVAP